jgi:hypothetical protein
MIIIIISFHKNILKDEPIEIEIELFERKRAMVPDERLFIIR